MDRARQSRRAAARGVRLTRTREKDPVEGEARAQRRAAEARLLRRSAGRGVLLAELVDAPRGIDDLLLAGIERMAVRAHLDLQIVPERRARLERVATRAGDGDLFVLGMNGGFHGGSRDEGAAALNGAEALGLKGAGV